MNLAIIDTIFNMDLAFLPERFREMGSYKIQDYFELKWYSLVGINFIMTVFTNVFVQPGAMIGVHYVGCIQRFCSSCFCKPKHQDDLNAIWTLPMFRLSDRYAQTLSMVLVVMTFSAGMPLLTPMLAVFFFFCYWTDKFMLLKGSQRPPVLDEATAKQTCRFMFLAAILHCLVGGQMLGNQTAFPSASIFGEDDLFSEHIDNGSDPFLSTMLKRYVTEATFGYACILALCVGMGVLLFVVKYLLGGTLGSVLKFMCGCLCDKKEAQVEDDSDPALATTYRAMAKLMKKHKMVSSYNPSKNPAYAKFVRALDDRGKGVAGRDSELAQEDDPYYQADGVFLADM